jgi:hypothetical protein
MPQPNASTARPEQASPTNETKIKDGTPPAKQARRNEQSLKHWKASAVKKTEVIKSERRMKEENRKQRDAYKELLKTKSKELLASDELVQENEKKLHETQQLLVEEQKKRIKAEKELEKITEQVRASEGKLKSMVTTQAVIATQIHQVHVDVSNHLYELHQLDDKKDLDSQVILDEELKIDLQIEKIEKNVQCLREDLEYEKNAHQVRKDQVKSIASKKKAMKKP